MVRIAVAVAIIALTLPVALSGQWQDDFLEEETPRFQLTPYVTLQLPYTTRGTYGIVTSGESLLFDRDQVHAPSIGAGAQASYRIGEDWGVLGSFSYAPSVNVVVREEEWDTGHGRTGLLEPFETLGPDLLLARVAAFYELPRTRSALQGFPVRGAVSVGPSLVRQSQMPTLGLGDTAFRPIYHWGLNGGVDATLPVEMFPNLSFYAGAEGHLAFWNTAEMQRQEELLFEEVGVVADVELDFNPGYIGTLRFGASYGF